MQGIYPINLSSDDMAEALGFSRAWLDRYRSVLLSCNAICYDGRWHIASTEEAYLIAVRRGLLKEQNERARRDRAEREQNKGAGLLKSGAQSLAVRGRGRTRSMSGQEAVNTAAEAAA